VCVEKRTHGFEESLAVVRQPFDSLSLFEILTIIFKNFKSNPYQKKFLANSYFNWYEKLDTLREIEAIGQVLYTHFILQFLIAGYILFLAVIGSIVLTITPPNKKSKSQIIYKQISRTKDAVL
jgi:NADH:ubiquinone oxidoreductase subunit 6 (subunit J)